MRAHTHTYTQTHRLPSCSIFVVACGAMRGYFQVNPSPDAAQQLLGLRRMQQTCCWATGPCRRMRKRWAVAASCARIPAYSTRTHSSASEGIRDSAGSMYLHRRARMHTLIHTSEKGHIRATHAVDKASPFLCLTAVQQSSSLEYKVSMCFLPWEALLMFSGHIYDSAAIEF